MLAIKSLEHMQRDYDYYRDTRRGYEENYYKSWSDLNYFLDGVKHKDSNDSNPEPLTEEIKLIWNRFTEDKNTRISRLEKYNTNLVEPLDNLLKARYEYPHYQEIMKIVRECTHWYTNLTSLISVIRKQLSSHADNLEKAKNDLEESVEYISNIENRIPSLFNWVKV